MSGIDLLFQLYGLLLGLSIAELLAGLARSWRIWRGATRTGKAQIRIGYLVPLLGLLVLADQTHFWVSAHALREFVAFNYATLLAMVTIIGGYYILSTFVFPDDPADWPDFDDYYLRTNRTVVAGMFVINFTVIGYGLLMATRGFDVQATQIARNWLSISAALAFLPGLVVLWFVKSKRANLVLLLVMNALLLMGAIGPIL